MRRAAISAFAGMTLKLKIPWPFDQDKLTLSPKGDKKRSPLFDEVP